MILVGYISGSSSSVSIEVEDNRVYKILKKYYFNEDRNGYQIKEVKKQISPDEIMSEIEVISSKMDFTYIHNGNMEECIDILKSLIREIKIDTIIK